jgi:SET domain-containing protein
MSRVAQAEKKRAKIPAHLRLGRSGVHGYGLFARDFIPQDTRIIEYVGERVTKAEALRREDERLARRAGGGDGCVYVFVVNKRHDIDGRVPWNPARRINHSCAPNCEAQNIRGRIWIEALRDIAPDEELNYNYGFDYGECRDHPCRCGSSQCVGFIVEAAQRWRVKRALAATQS